MSVRARPVYAPSVDAAAIRSELAAAAATHAAANAQAASPFATAAREGGLTLADLSPTEVAVTQLGVSPDELKPIGWLNAAHYSALKKQQLLGSDLARRIEAYSVVAGKDAAAAAQ